ncbi:MAG TPA: transposase, partial [Planctomycetota bacterium]|nr:transposase [Planctomycetota bacterium]
YFEGLDSQRAISWRCSDSLSLRQFLGLSAGDETPDHSSLTRIRKRLTPAIHTKVFAFALQTAREKGALSTKRLGVNSKYVEANAAMRTIVRLDAADDWTSWLARLARVEAPKPGAASGDGDEADLPRRAEEQQSAAGPGGAHTTPAAPAGTRQDDANAGMGLE